MMSIFERLNDLSFAGPGGLWLALALLLLIPCWWRLRSAVAHTFTGMHNIRSVGWPGIVCVVLMSVAWLAFTVAMAKPRLAHSEFRESVDARDFVIGIDKSGSMGSADIKDAEARRAIDEFEKKEAKKEEELRKKFPALYPFPPDKSEKKEVDEDMVERFQMARYAAVRFIQSRPKGDRLAMFVFNDEVFWAWPLSTDRKVVRDKVSTLNRDASGGTNFDGPTGSSPRLGAFQATIDHFESLGKAKTKVMIFISDGDDGISASRHQELVEQMTKEGQEIHVFVLHTGKKEKLKQQATASLRRMVKAVNPPDWKDSKGNPVDPIMLANDFKAMEKAFALINELETTKVEMEPIEGFKDVSHEFVLVGCIAFALFLAACAMFRESI